MCHFTIKTYDSSHLELYFRNAKFNFVDGARINIGFKLEVKFFVGSSSILIRRSSRLNCQLIDDVSSPQIADFNPRKDIFHVANYQLVPKNSKRLIFL